MIILYIHIKIPINFYQIKSLDQRLTKLYFAHSVLYAFFLFSLLSSLHILSNFYFNFSFFIIYLLFYFFLFSISFIFRSITHGVRGAGNRSTRENENGAWVTGAGVVELMSANQVR